MATMTRKGWYSYACLAGATRAARSLRLNGQDGRPPRAEIGALMRRPLVIARLKDHGESKSLRISLDLHHPMHAAQITARLKRDAAAAKWVESVKARKKAK